VCLSMPPIMTSTFIEKLKSKVPRFQLQYQNHLTIFAFKRRSSYHYDRRFYEKRGILPTWRYGIDGVLSVWIATLALLEKLKSKVPRFQLQYQNHLCSNLRHSQFIFLCIVSLCILIYIIIFSVLLFSLHGSNLIIDIFLVIMEM
jgi:hypothetical protein